MTITNMDGPNYLSRHQVIAGPHGYRPSKFKFFLDPTPGDNTALTWSYGYDVATVMDITSITAPGGAPFAEYTYNGDGRLATRELAGAAVETLNYSADALYPYGITQGGASVATMIYDSKGRLAIADDLRDNKPLVYFGYDTDGQVTQILDGSQSWTYTHDTLGNVVTASDGTDSFVYGRDALGNLTSVTKNGLVVRQMYYENAAYPKKVTRQETAAGTAYWEYDANGRLCARISTNGGIRVYTRDFVGRLLAVERGMGGEPALFLQRNKLGQVSLIADLDRGWIRTVDYDVLGRVSALGQFMGGSVSYSYSPGGEVTSRTVSGGASAYLANVNPNWYMRQFNGDGDDPGEGEMCTYGPFHSAGTRESSLIELSELPRIIPFLNSNGYSCQAGTEDGYCPGLTE